jgi:hypothetical protein
VSEGYGNLDITEIHYHPLPGEGTDEKEYEFIELKNSGTVPIDLGGMAFIRGITYTFPAGTSIQADSHLVLASNAQVFNTRYHFTPFGQYAGQLSNAGETITMATSQGDTVINLTYGTAFPWPGSPDGAGYSLIRRPDRMYQDINDPSSWCSSVAIHGDPGKNDEMPTGVKIGESIPVEFRLHQNYPNPFNPSTVIKYQLPANTFVSLKIYDILGREVITLVNGKEKAGDHSAIFDARSLPSGVYFYRLQAGPFAETKKLVLLR